MHAYLRLLYFTTLILLRMDDYIILSLASVFLIALFIYCSLYCFWRTILFLAVCTGVCRLFADGLDPSLRMLLVVDLTAIIIKLLQQLVRHVWRLCIIIDARKHPDRYDYRRGLVFNQKTGKIEETSSLILPF